MQILLYTVEEPYTAEEPSRRYGYACFTCPYIYLKCMVSVISIVSNYERHTVLKHWMLLHLIECSIGNGRLIETRVM